MNPLTLVRRTQNINAKEAELGISDQASWHANYKDSAYVYAGGLPFDLTEGDLLAVFAQYGEIVDVNLVREKSTGKSKGFAFIAYEDQRSTILAVDNLNGAQLAGRTIRVDHVSNYKKKEEEDEETERLKREERGVCRAFQRGECKYGDSCRFSHDEQRAANTGWGPEEERKVRSAYNKFDKSSANDKRSHAPPTHAPPTHAPPTHAPKQKELNAYEGRSLSVKKTTGDQDQNIGDRAKRFEHKEDRDKQASERKTSRYEPEFKKPRDRDEREEIKTSRRDKGVRDVRDERDRDRSRDRGKDIDKKRDTDREGNREKQMIQTRDYTSKHRREREDDDHRRDRHDEDYRKSRR